MLGPWLCSLHHPPPHPTSRSSDARPEAGHAGGPPEEGRKAGIRPLQVLPRLLDGRVLPSRPKGRSKDLRVFYLTGFALMVPRVLYFSSGPLESCPKTAPGPPSPPPRCPSASSPACWGHSADNQALAIPDLSSSYFSGCPPREGGRWGGKERGRGYSQGQLRLCL